MDTEVSTAQGVVRGAYRDGILSFKGIPYAAAPYGAHRFAHPAPAPAWDGVRGATSFGPTVAKPPYPSPLDRLLPERDAPGEDCLNLNVWTPDTGGRLPVLVWLHGGAFVHGSGSVGTYDGTAFARDGVVCVTINYRLGAEGFLLIDEAPANRGLLDQLAALRWVQDNIACFGGDPDAVTVAGESAGAMSVTTLLSMPASTGLFRRAIAQSGAGHHVQSAETARKVTAALAEHLEVPPTVEGFGSVPVDAFVAAQAALSARIAREPDPVVWGEITADTMAFEPCVDGTVLAARPIDNLAAGVSADIDMLIGTNSDEYTLFLVPSGVADVVSEETLRLTITAHGVDAAAAISAYHAARPGSTPGEVLAAVLRDRAFWIPAIRVAEARARHGADTHFYEFDWKSPQLDGRLGATHALEIGFVFDTLHDPAGAPLRGAHPPQEVADHMHGSWVSFVTTGDPGWPVYGSDRTVQRFGDAPGPVTDPAPGLRALWHGAR